MMERVEVISTHKGGIDPQTRKSMALAMKERRVLSMGEPDEGDSEGADIRVT
jgi:hypothetical protein